MDLQQHAILGRQRRHSHEGTCVGSSLICQPQHRNMHGRVFGGFLMYRAFKLAFSTAYAFAGLVSFFSKVDHIEFLKPVDVGDFLRFRSCVLYTKPEDHEQPLIHVEVVAHVTSPEKRSAEVSNTFYFSLAVRPEAKAMMKKGLQNQECDPRNRGRSSSYGSTWILNPWTQKKEATSRW